MMKTMILAMSLAVSMTASADEPEFMVVPGALDCASTQYGLYLCRSKHNNEAQGTDSLMLDYEGIIALGGKAYVPVVTYQVASK
jgi:hypothetical protein